MTLGIFGVLTEGSEVRLVSPDLTTVYSTAKIENDRLQFESFPPPGADIRVIVFPPDSVRATPSSGEAQRAMSTSPRAFRGVVTVTHDDILVYVNNQLTSFRLTLDEEYGVSLGVLSE